MAELECAQGANSQLLDSQDETREHATDEQYCSAVVAGAHMPDQSLPKAGDIIAECRDSIRELTGNLESESLPDIRRVLAEIDEKLDLAANYFNLIDPSHRPLRYVREVKTIRGKKEQDSAIEFIVRRYLESGATQPVDYREVQEYLGKKSVTAVRMLLSEPISQGRILRADPVKGGLIPSIETLQKA